MNNRIFLLAANSGYGVEFLMVPCPQICSDSVLVERPHKLTTKHQVIFGWTILFGFLIACQPAHACLWLHGTTIEGRPKTVEGRRKAAYLKKTIAAQPKDRRDLFAPFDYRPDDPLASSNDSAVQALLKGDAANAVQMLIEIEAKSPGHYFTAANLGTAYELVGDDESALKWILEGIKRNPESHMFTEWLHARILETKIKLKSDPTWLETHTITGADFSRLKDAGYQLATRQEPVSWDKLRHCLWSQLSVRILFVKPKDIIVGQLLFELAQIEAGTGLVEEAVHYLDMAEQYGFPSSVLSPLRASCVSILRWTSWFTWPQKLFPGVGFTGNLLALSLLVLLVLILVRVSLRRRRQCQQIV